MPALTPNGFQPETRSAPSRRADFDLLRRVAELERSLAETNRVLNILADNVTVSTYVPFTFNSTRTEPIVGNQVRINTVTQNTATRLWVSHTTFDGLAVTVGLRRAVPGTLIHLQDFNNAALWVRYTVVSATDDGTYHDFTVTYDSGPGNLLFQKIVLQIVFPGI